MIIMSEFHDFAHRIIEKLQGCVAALSYGRHFSWNMNPTGRMFCIPNNNQENVLKLPISMCAGRPGCIAAPHHI